MCAKRNLLILLVALLMFDTMWAVASTPPDIKERNGIKLRLPPTFVVLADEMGFFEQDASRALAEKLSTLQNEDGTMAIDSVIYYTSSAEHDIYRLSYTQYRLHGEREKDELKEDSLHGKMLKLKALLHIRRNVADAAQLPMVAYVSGYSLNGMQINRSRLGNSPTELAIQLNANFLELEHRYAGQSATGSPWEHLGACVADEAAEDFHYIMSNVKQVFGEKWLMTGVSKGGITTAMQAVFHPEDADVFVPVAAPFCPITDDPDLYNYILSDATWTPAFHGKVNEHFREIYERVVYPFVKYRKDNIARSGSEEYQQKTDSLAALLMYLNYIYYFAHSYNSRDVILRAIDNNVNLIRKHEYFQSKGVDYYNFNILKMLGKSYKIELDENIINAIQTEEENEWVAKNVNAEDAPRRSLALKADSDDGTIFNIFKRYSTFAMKGVTEENYDYVAACYEFQKRYELGSAEGQVVLPFLFDDSQLYEELSGLIKEPDPAYVGIQLRTDLRKYIMDGLKKIEKPVYFIYGQDDFWTGRAIEDDVVAANANLHKEIFYAQNHLVALTHEHDASISICFNQEEIDADKSRRDGYLNAILNDMEVSTGITALPGSAGQTTRQNGIFNLHGQRVSNMRRGQIYIVNGRKIVK